mgnify:CR=1 FL=1
MATMDEAKKLLKAERIAKRRERVEAKRNKGGPSGPSVLSSTTQHTGSRASGDRTNSRNFRHGLQSKRSQTLSSINRTLRAFDGARRSGDELNDTRKGAAQGRRVRALLRLSSSRFATARWAEVAQNQVPEELYQGVLSQFEATR